VDAGRDDLSVLYIARVGLERLVRTLPLHAPLALSVLYIARVGLERQPWTRKRVVEWLTFSPLHSEGGIGTPAPPKWAGSPRSPFSPLHSEGGIGTTLTNEFHGTTCTAFSPLHIEGGIGTDQGWW